MALNEILFVQQFLFVSCFKYNFYHDSLISIESNVIHLGLTEITLKL